MRGNDGLGDIGDPSPLIHRRFAQFGISLGLRQSATVHQDALGLVDHLALRKLALGLGKIGLQTREGIEPVAADAAPEEARAEARAEKKRLKELRKAEKAALKAAQKEADKAAGKGGKKKKADRKG